MVEPTYTHTQTHAHTHTQSGRHTVIDERQPEAEGVVVFWLIVFSSQTITSRYTTEKISCDDVFSYISNVS